MRTRAKWALREYDMLRIMSSTYEYYGLLVQQVLKFNKIIFANRIVPSLKDFLFPKRNVIHR
jgi:hypothetical protein